MTAPLKIDPARCLELVAWAREVAQVRDEDVVAGADAEATARTRENMAAIADQLDAAAHAAERWLAALDVIAEPQPIPGAVPQPEAKPVAARTFADVLSSPAFGKLVKASLDAQAERTERGLRWILGDAEYEAMRERLDHPPGGAETLLPREAPPAITHDFLPPLSDPPARIPTTEELRALQQPATVVQPRSVPNDGPAIVDLVIDDLRQRAQHGEAKYGVKLQAHNGRVALVDAYQEVLDLAQYIRQEIEERRRAGEEGGVR